MGDIELFKTGNQGATELEGKSVVVEKTLQALMEEQLDEFLGVHFLASEYQTGKTHRGRIDSLGMVGCHPSRQQPDSPSSDAAKFSAESTSREGRSTPRGTAASKPDDHPTRTRPTATLSAAIQTTHPA